MRRIHRTSQFKKDIKRIVKRRKKFGKLKEVIAKLVADVPLDAKYRDHNLVGQYKGTRECHIESDWLLIYETTENELVLVRTGTHSDLFR